jgi:tRNA dimethylallyltransferase
VRVAPTARHASPIITDILSRNKTPIICGGTGQYIDALIYGENTPPVPPNKKLRETLEKKSTEELFLELSRIDEHRARMIDRNNRVRLIRALEIATTLGYVPKQKEQKLIYNMTIYIMNPDRVTLRTRVTNRLEKRLQKGMIEEVARVMKKLQPKGNDEISPFMKKLGLEYVTISRYLQKKITYEEMKEELITKTMQYAKRQMTWNKKYIPHATLIPVK